MSLTFHPLSRPDFRLLEGWLTQPHVSAWWDGRHDLESLEAKYGPRIDGQSSTRVFTVRLNDEPVGLIQYTPGDEYACWPSERGLDDVIVLDCLIGEPSQVGRNVGATAIDGFVEMVFAATEARRAAAAPQARNIAACRALEKAGFTCVFAGDLVTDHQPGRRIYVRDAVACDE